MKLITRPNQKRKGAALVEYALLIAGVSLIAAASVSLFGHKTTDLIATVTAILPGAHDGDNGPILSGHLIETTNAAAGANSPPIAIDTQAVLSHNGQSRLNNNVFGPGQGQNGDELGLVIETP